VPYVDTWICFQHWYRWFCWHRRVAGDRLSPDWLTPSEFL